MWGVKCRADLGLNHSSVTDNLWGPGTAFLRGVVEPQCHSCLSCVTTVREAAGVLGKCLVPKAGLPGFVS